MKKHVLFLFATLLSLVTNAHDFEVDGIYYNIASSTNLTVEVTYKGNAWNSYSSEYKGAVSIPATVIYNGMNYSVTSIGEFTFCMCSSLTSITIPEGVTSIGDYAFAYCSLTAITIPESVTSIGSGAFEGCSSLTAITIPENSQLTSIAGGTFSSCSSLTAITIPEGVTSIGDEAFYGCRSLTAITIPESVTWIGERAFYGCSSLTAINIPEGVTNIGEDAFESTAWYNNQTDGVVYAGKVLYKYKGTMPDNTSIEVKEGTKGIADYAFAFYYSSLTAITLPTSVTSIGNYAFCDCSNLTAITIPESSQLTSIGEYAFCDCSNLTAITIPESSQLTSIGEYAFCDCSSLTAITLPASVTKIEDMAFGRCAELSDVYSYAETAPSAHSDTFGGSSPENATLHVPASSLESYKSTSPWSSFGKIESIKIPVSEITLSHTSVTLNEGASMTLEATITPDDASDPSVTWSSSNEDVAMVSSKGRVITLAAGTTTITATANDGSGASASCEVRVVIDKCDAPTISYVDGGFVLTCNTEGAEIRTTVITENDNEFVGTRFEFIPTHTFTAYATKANYEDSDVATLTLCWIPCDENHEESDDIVTIPSKPVLISARDGVLTLSGLAEGTEVTLYTTDGVMVAHQQSCAGEAKFTVDTNQVYIVKVADKVVKIGM